MQTCPHCLQSMPNGTQVCPSCGVPIPTPLELPANSFLKTRYYQLESVLGRGGFGITYLATDKRLNRQVAIKEFFPEGSTRTQTFVTNQNPQDFLESKQRFLEEARVLARFEHVGIVRVFDVFEDNNTAYLVMEALQGRTLAKALESGAIEPRDVETLASDLCSTLEVVHRAGWLHRDIKPDNIFITQDDRVVLIDFGSARMFQSKRTMRHTRLVTPGYAAPEQFASSAQFGAFTDVYGLAATLYHALTGNMPPSATDRFVGSRVPSLGADVPAGLKQAIEQGLALKVSERPQSARDFLGLVQGKNLSGLNTSRTSNPVVPANKDPYLIPNTPVVAKAKAPVRNPNIRFKRDDLTITDTAIVLAYTTPLGTKYDREFTKNEVTRVLLESSNVWLSVPAIGGCLLVTLGIVTLSIRISPTWNGLISFMFLMAGAGLLDSLRRQKTTTRVLLEINNYNTIEVFSSDLYIAATEVRGEIEKFLA